MNTREFAYSMENFRYLSKMAKELAGIELTEAKSDMVYSRIVRLIRKHHLKSFDEYCSLLSQNLTEENVSDFVNAITTNLTNFFREVHHFNELKSTILPELKSRNQLRKNINVWSAGCSTGEEPYSIAFVLRDFFLGDTSWNLQITASDIDSSVLAKAKSGVYNIDQAKNDINAEQMARWFKRGSGNNEGLCRVKPEYQSLIQFERVNLMEVKKFASTFDIIFCRNVLIYFNSANQNKILDYFMDNLTEGGYLFIGHSESFVNHYKRVKLIGKTIYRKL